LKRVAFISHSSKDKPTAESVCRFLESKGISCWIAPRDVTPGKNYGVAIVDGIDECGVFVLILSAESNKSGQVVREVERAASGNAVIIPVRVEPVQPSRELEFYVSSSHWLDATQRPFEKHLDSLVDAIRNWQNEGGPTEAVKSSDFPAAPTASRRRDMPFLIGGVVVAVVVAGLAIFLASRSRTTPQTPVASASSPSAQQNPPRMGLARRRAAREQASTESGSPNSPAPITESASPGPNENAQPASMPVIDRVTASSERPPVTYMGEMRHFEAMHAFDGNVKTVWIPMGSGPGEWIEVFFKAPASISSVSVFGGGGADVEHHMANNRVHELRMTFSNGFSRTMTLEDKMDFQTLNLPHRPVLRSVKFEIISVYHGDKNDVTPIAEIEFDRPE
jgi:hypothetical protein